MSLMIYAGFGDGNASRGQHLSSCMGEWIWRKDNDKVRVLRCSLSLMCLSLSLNSISFYQDTRDTTNSKLLLYYHQN